MSALANVLLTSLPAENLLTDSATVGYDATFAPEGWKLGGIAAWANREDGVPAGFPRLTFQFKGPNKDSQTYRSVTKLVMPVLETIDPAVGIFGPKIAYLLEADIDLRIHSRATSAERIVFLNYLRSLLATNVQATDGTPADAVGSPTVNFLKNLEDVY